MTPIIDLTTAQPGSALINAAYWVDGVVFGQLGSILAIIGVALVGFLMLQGRIEWRRGAMVCSGCFLIFGAKALAASFLAVPELVGMSVEASVSPRLADEVPPIPELPAYDPYAGASLPQH